MDADVATFGAPAGGRNAVPDGGRRSAAHGVAAALPGADDTTPTLLVFRQPGADDPAKSHTAGLVAAHLAVIDLPANRRTAAARAARNALRVARRVPPLVDRFAGFGARGGGARQGRRYDIGIVEHFWCAPYLEQLAAVCGRTVLDLHNVESVLHQRCAAADGGAAGIGASRLRSAPRANWSGVAAALRRGAGDVGGRCRDGPRDRARRARCGLSERDPARRRCRRGGDDEAIVFSGNMEYHPNRSAVRFFRREVWPLLRERWPRLVWRLVGKNPEAVREFTSGDPRIEVAGAVDDAVAELARCRAAVVPLLAGSGTRLKILEAWAAGLPVVSTTHRRGGPGGARRGASADRRRRSRHSPPR